MYLRAVPVYANLQLQKLLYFNYYYAFVFAAAHIATAAYKLRWLYVQDTTKFLVPVVFCLWAICEIVRLRLGYSGNLKEKVPEMSAFWLLSIFPQVPLVIIISFLQTAIGDHMPLDLAMGIMMVIFIVFELYFSYKAVRAFIRKQTADFYRICQEESLSIAAARDLARRTQPVLVQSALFSESSTGYTRLATSDPTAVSPLSIAREGVRALLTSRTEAENANQPASARLHED